MYYIIAIFDGPTFLEPQDFGDPNKITSTTNVHNLSRQGKWNDSSGRI